jgi:3-methyladenine DNA glycosylase Mpg
MLDFLRRDYPHYAWSIRTLDRRFSYFDIKRTDRNVTVDQVKEAVQKELNGPGQLLGYRAMQKKVRQEHNLNVPRGLVHAVMVDLDPEGLEQRGGVGIKKKQERKRKFYDKGSKLGTLTRRTRQAYGVSELHVPTSTVWV